MTEEGSIFVLNVRKRKVGNANYKISYEVHTFNKLTCRERWKRQVDSVCDTAPSRILIRKKLNYLASCSDIRNIKVNGILAQGVIDALKTQTGYVNPKSLANLIKSRFD